MKKLVLAMVLLATATGCQPANISATMRGSDSSVPGMQTRCETGDMRDEGEIGKIFSKYDGWRLIYMSEYTTGNRFGTVGIVCFEKPMK